MGIISVFDKTIADELSAIGFTYYIQVCDGRSAYCFIADKGLLGYMYGKYENGKQFLVNKHMKF